MLERITQHWWILLIRGILSLVVGIVAIAVPIATAFVLALLFGAYALIDGVIAIVASIRMTHADGRWGWLLAEGIVSTLFGAIALYDPFIAIFALVIMIAAWAIVTGGAAIATAWRLRTHIKGEWFWILAGLLSILFGVAVVFEPGLGLFFAVSLFAIYTIVTGIVFIGLAFRLRKAHPALRS